MRRHGDPGLAEPGTALVPAMRTASPQQVETMRRIWSAMSRGEPCEIKLPCRRCGEEFTVSAYVRGVAADFCAKCCQAMEAKPGGGTRRLNRPAAPYEFSDAALIGDGGSLEVLCDWTTAYFDEEAPDKPINWCTVLAGPPGAGKTWATWAVVHRCLSFTAVPTMEHLTAYDLVSEVRGSWKRDWRGEQPTLNEGRYTDRCGLLVLDDLSSDRLQRDGARELAPIIDRRWSSHLATLITTNDNRETFYDLVGPSLASRIIGSGRWLDFPPIDRRVAKR